MKSLAVLLTFVLALSAHSSTTSNPKNSEDKILADDTIRKPVLDSIPKAIGWVNDFEGIFTQKQIAELKRIIIQFEKETTMEIVIVSIDQSMTNANQFDDYTELLASTWGVGKKDSDNGVLIAFSKELRKIRIQNGLGTEKLISDSETKTILDSFIIPKFKEGDYYQGTELGLKELIKLLKTKL